MGMFSQRAFIVRKQDPLMQGNILPGFTNNSNYLNLFNPFTPKFKKYILLTFSKNLYKWDSESW